MEIGVTTPGSEYVEKEAGTGPGCRKKLIEGNIDGWKLMKRMEMNERENDEAVTSRAKEETKRVTGTRTGAGSAVSALGAAQEMRVCFCSVPDADPWMAWLRSVPDVDPGHPRMARARCG